jgi:hypothetical protein
VPLLLLLQVQVLTRGTPLTEGAKAFLEGIVRQELATALRPVEQELRRLNDKVDDLTTEVQEW